MDPDDDSPEPGRQVVLVPVLRAEDLARATLWYLAAEGNEKARAALRDGPGTC